jgi:hypothetical protein
MTGRAPFDLAQDAIGVPVLLRPIAHRGGMVRQLSSQEVSR